MGKAGRNRSGYMTRKQRDRLAFAIMVAIAIVFKVVGLENIGKSVIGWTLFGVSGLVVIFIFKD